MDIVGNGIGQHYPAKKAIPVNTSICKSLKLIPINNNSNGWIIKSDY